MFRAALCGAAALVSVPAMAQPAESDFLTGPVIADFGTTLPVPGAQAIPAGAEFAVAFDVSKEADTGEINRTLNSAARFLNMHVRAGVEPENIRIAIVVHGRAVRDVANAATYAAAHGGAGNANAAAVAALLGRGATIHVCGQSAAYYGVGAEDLLPGVRMEISAMTAHALLQQLGYTLNPF
ncbi:MAG: DsrE family protein [Parasphingopyxis sp.]|uniref:DsrE family protein n=1 Tax=Parasphingopyxis sp. TaxID=1920299 RepID=UPI00260A2E76|nr:DsrE family protein [uncultured Parasphingopyxis sp.]